MPERVSKRRWYGLAVEIRRANPTALDAITELTGRTISRQRRCSLNRIAKMHPELGLLCDELEAPWDVVRAIAHAPGEAERRKRAEQLLGELIAKRAERNGEGQLERDLREGLERLLDRDVNVWRDGARS